MLRELRDIDGVAIIKENLEPDRRGLADLPVIPIIRLPLGPNQIAHFHCSLVPCLSLLFEADTQMQVGN